MDLLLILGASLATIPLALFTSGAVRVAFAVAFLLFSPGYSLIAALYPRSDGLDSIERLALSFGTSIAVVPLIGLLLNYTPWGIRLTPILVCVDTFIIAMCAVAWVRRRRLLPAERFRVAFSIPALRWHDRSLADRALTIALIASIAFAVGVLIHVVSTPKQGEEFSEFYILGTDGRAEGYPTSIPAGQGEDLIIGVVNHEGEPVIYHIRVRLADDEDAVLLTTEAPGVASAAANSIVLEELDDEASWEDIVSVRPLSRGDRRKLEFLLFSPRLRVGYNLRASLDGDGYARLELDEGQGQARVGITAGNDTSHVCRLEAWQSGVLCADTELLVEAGEELHEDFDYPPGETRFRLYDGNTLVLDDSGAELSLHLWIDVT